VTSSSSHRNHQHWKQRDDIIDLFSLWRRCSIHRCLRIPSGNSSFKNITVWWKETTFSFITYPVKQLTVFCLFNNNNNINNNSNLVLPLQLKPHLIGYRRQTHWYFSQPSFLFDCCYSMVLLIKGTECEVHWYTVLPLSSYLSLSLSLILTLNIFLRLSVADQHIIILVFCCVFNVIIFDLYTDLHYSTCLLFMYVRVMDRWYILPTSQRHSVIVFLATAGPTFMYWETIDKFKRFKQWGSLWYLAEWRSKPVASLSSRTWSVRGHSWCCLPACVTMIKQLGHLVRDCVWSMVIIFVCGLMTHRWLWLRTQWGDTKLNHCQYTKASLEGATGGRSVGL